MTPKRSRHSQLQGSVRQELAALVARRALRQARTRAASAMTPLHQPGHATDSTARIDRRQVLGGLISEYRKAA